MFFCIKLIRRTVFHAIMSVLYFIDARKKDLIEIILDVPMYALTTSDRDKIIQQMTLLLHDVKLILSSMRSQIHTGCLLRLN